MSPYGDWKILGHAIIKQKINPDICWEWGIRVLWTHYSFIYFLVDLMLMIYTCFQVQTNSMFKKLLQPTEGIVSPLK